MASEIRTPINICHMSCIYISLGSPPLAKENDREVLHRHP